MDRQSEETRCLTGDKLMSEVLDKLKISLDLLAGYQLDYNDFDRLVEEVYGRSYSFVVENESSNDQLHSFARIDGLMKDYDDQEMEDFINDGEQCCSGTILNDLASKDIIPIGDYYVWVCW